jgi:hypothetical protein
MSARPDLATVLIYPSKGVCGTVMENTALNSGMCDMLARDAPSVLADLLA